MPIKELLLDIDNTLFTPHKGKIEFGELGKLGEYGLYAVLFSSVLAKTVFQENKRFESEAIRRLQVQNRNLLSDPSLFIEQQKEDFDWLGGELRRAISPSLWESFILKAHVMSAQFDPRIIAELKLLKLMGMKISIATDSVSPIKRIALIKLMYPQVFERSRVWTSKDLGIKKANPSFFRQVADELGELGTAVSLVIDDMPKNLVNAREAQFATAQVRTDYPLSKLLGI